MGISIISERLLQYDSLVKKLNRFPLHAHGLEDWSKLRATGWTMRSFAKLDERSFKLNHRIEIKKAIFDDESERREVNAFPWLNHIYLEALEPDDSKLITLVVLCKPDGPTSFYLPRDKALSYLFGTLLSLSYLLLFLFFISLFGEFARIFSKGSDYPFGDAAVLWVFFAGFAGFFSLAYGCSTHMRLVGTVKLASQVDNAIFLDRRDNLGNIIDRFQLERVAQNNMQNLPSEAKGLQNYYVKLLDELDGLIEELRQIQIKVVFSYRRKKFWHNSAYPGLDALDRVFIDGSDGLTHHYFGGKIDSPWPEKAISKGKRTLVTLKNQIIDKKDIDQVTVYDSMASGKLLAGIVSWKLYIWIISSFLIGLSGLFFGIFLVTFLAVALLTFLIMVALAEDVIFNGSDAARERGLSRYQLQVRRIGDRERHTVLASRHFSELTKLASELLEEAREMRSDSAL